MKSEDQIKSRICELIYFSDGTDDNIVMFALRELVAVLK